MACNGDFYFTYCDERGLTKAVRNKETRKWEFSKINDRVKELKNVNLVVHQGKLFMRHSKIESSIVPVNLDDMTLQTTEPVSLADEETKKRFCWTTEENVITEERGKRWMHSAPMASDG